LTHETINNAAELQQDNQQFAQQQLTAQQPQPAAMPQQGVPNGIGQ
jgi:hypothetical protein